MIEYHSEIQGLLGLIIELANEKKIISNKSVMYLLQVKVQSHMEPQDKFHGGLNEERMWEDSTSHGPWWPHSPW